MEFSDFTLPLVKRQFRLSIDELSDLFADAPEVDLPAGLAELLGRYLPRANWTRGPGNKALLRWLTAR